MALSTALLVLGIMGGGAAVGESTGCEQAAEDCQADLGADDASLLALKRAGMRSEALNRGQSAADGIDSPYVRPKWLGELPLGEIPNNPNCSKPPCSEQVHIQLGAPKQMVVSFVSPIGSETMPRVKYAKVSAEKSCDGVDLVNEASGTTEEYTLLMYWTRDAWDPPMGKPALTPDEVASMRSTLFCQDLSTGWKMPCYHKYTAEDIENWDGHELGYYINPKENYDSPRIHTVLLEDLLPGASYCYSVENDDRVFKFKMPSPSGYPFQVGMVADPGQTAASRLNFALLRLLSPEVVLCSGDLSYADGYGPRWDTFGRIFEALGAHVPMAFCPGNHEQSSGEAYVPYNKRYPMKPAAEASGSLNPNFWSQDIGPLHVISLNSYDQTRPGSAMYRWLEEDLAKYNASNARNGATPWLVAMMHVPWYNSNRGHIGEGNLMKMHMEPLFYKYGVNMVLNGHVHSYERTKPMYRNDTDACGPVYLNLGDGGNREGPYLDWLPGQDGEPRPAWTAFRQGSFGVSLLRFVNDTHAKFKWLRLSCFDTSSHNNMNLGPHCNSTEDDPSLDATEKADEAWIQRPLDCPNNMR